VRRNFNAALLAFLQRVEIVRRISSERYARPTANIDATLQAELARFALGAPRSAWYNDSMALQLGNGPTLKDACPWLQDDAARHQRILDVTERNSVIEGLPPFQEETRQRLMAQLQGLVRPQPAPAE
jgi:hypothetical protein